MKIKAIEKSATVKKTISVLDIVVGYFDVEFEEITSPFEMDFIDETSRHHYKVQELRIWNITSLGPSNSLLPYTVRDLLKGVGYDLIGLEVEMESKKYILDEEDINYLRSKAWQNK